MKYGLGIVAMLAVLLAGGGQASAATPVVGENASEKACFGQWRASASDGSEIAARQGGNASQNAADKVTCSQPDPVLVPNGGYPAVWADVPRGSTIDSWGYYNRDSASYVAFKVYQSGRHVPYGWGNPNQWPAQAVAYGIPVSSTPQAGDAAISMAGYYGHAMYVEGVNADGSIEVSQYNYDYLGNYSEMTVSASTAAGLKFIHF